jgi:hypothetical protein
MESPRGMIGSSVKFPAEHSHSARPDGKSATCKGVKMAHYKEHEEGEAREFR